MNKAKYFFACHRIFLLWLVFLSKAVKQKIRPKKNANKSLNHPRPSQSGAAHWLKANRTTTSYFLFGLRLNSQIIKCLRSLSIKWG